MTKESSKVSTVELTDSDLDKIAGGGKTLAVETQKQTAEVKQTTGLRSDGELVQAASRGGLRSDGDLVGG